MPKSRALRRMWWTAEISAVRHCFGCGGRLRKTYVRAEKKRRLVCDECRLITYINPKVVAAMIPVASGGRVVLLKRAMEPGKGRWTYPGGHMEMGESVVQAAERETWEEIKAKVTPLSVVGLYSYRDAGVVTIVYEGRVDKGERPQPTDEAADVRFFAPDEIPWKQLAYRSTADALKDWVSSQRSGKKPKKKDTP